VNLVSEIIGEVFLL